MDLEVEEKRRRLVNRMLLHGITGELLIDHDAREIIYDAGSKLLMSKTHPGFVNVKCDPLAYQTNEVCKKGDRRYYYISFTYITSEWISQAIGLPNLIQDDEMRYSSTMARRIDGDYAETSSLDVCSPFFQVRALCPISSQVPQRLGLVSVLGFRPLPPCVSRCPCCARFFWSCKYCPSCRLSDPTS